jgi:hypothetical protein
MSTIQLLEQGFDILLKSSGLILKETQACGNYNYSNRAIVSFTKESAKPQNKLKG